MTIKERNERNRKSFEDCGSLMESLEHIFIHMPVPSNQADALFVSVGSINPQLLNRAVTLAGKRHGLDVVEGDPAMRSTLQEKGCFIVHHDFLKYDTGKEYQVVMMRAPLGYAQVYLDRALALLHFGGTVICLHADHLEPEILQSNQFEQRTNYFEDGSAISFYQIDRHLPESLVLREIGSGKWFCSPEAGDAQLEDFDILRAAAGQYAAEVRAASRFIREYNALKPGFADIISGKNGSPIMSLLDHADGKHSEIDINTYISHARYKYWSELFRLHQFRAHFTSGLLTEYTEKIGELVHYDFDLYHIIPVYQSMVAQMSKSIVETVIAMFEELSCKYTYHEDCVGNAHYYNGWCSNKAWYINKKVVIPYRLLKGTIRSIAESDTVEKLQDIERAISFLDTGDSMGEVDIRRTLNDAVMSGNCKDIRLKHFSVTFYKKGTCHIRFSNEELLKKFNIFGSLHKNWLPPAYGRKRYKDLDEKEKAVVDSFEGKAEYEKVYNRQEYYLDQVPQVVLQPEERHELLTA